MSDINPWQPDETPAAGVNLLCRLPDHYIPVTFWEPHPCGGYYLVEAWCWGPQGPVGWLE